MLRCLLTVILSLTTLFAHAQTKDSIFAVKKGTTFAIRHVLGRRETLTMLAQRYYTTLLAIETLNKFDESKKLAPGDYVYIPLTTENYFVQKMPLDVTDLHRLYYKVDEKDNLGVIINYMPVRKGENPMTKDELRTMNEMHGYNLLPDQPLYIGLIRMVPPDSINIARGFGYPAPVKTTKDSVKHYFGGLDGQFNQQTSNGTNVLSEKGAAVFFDKPGKNTMYFAFHNTQPRNTIIKVTNPDNNKSIFVKVIGPIPNTKNFSNCLIAISNAAKEDLGVTENRSWVELAYPVN